MSAITKQGLQAVVSGDAVVGEYINLTHTAVNREYWTCQISSRNGSNLARSGSIKLRRRIQIDCAIDTTQVLMYIIGSSKESLNYLSFSTNRNHLASRVIKLVRIVRHRIEVQTILRKLCSVERT